MTKQNNYDEVLMLRKINKPEMCHKFNRDVIYVARDINI